MGYTHIELLPVAEASMTVPGVTRSRKFSPTSKRNRMVSSTTYHQEKLELWVRQNLQGHWLKFDETSCEHADPPRSTAIENADFGFGRNEVRSQRRLCRQIRRLQWMPLLPCSTLTTPETWRMGNVHGGREVSMPSKQRRLLRAFPVEPSPRLTGSRVPTLGGLEIWFQVEYGLDAPIHEPCLIHRRPTSKGLLLVYAISGRVLSLKPRCGAGNACRIWRKFWRLRMFYAWICTPRQSCYSWDAVSPMLEWNHNQSISTSSIIQRTFDAWSNIC